MWLAAAFFPTRPLSDQPWKTQRGKNVLISDSPSGPTRSSSDVRSIIMSYVCNLNLSHFPIRLMSSQYPCSAVNKCTSRAYCVPSMLCTWPKVNRLPRRASTYQDRGWGGQCHKLKFPIGFYQCWNQNTWILSSNRSLTYLFVPTSNPDVSTWHTREA